MTLSAPHHRLRLHSPGAPIPFSLDLTFAAPWTVVFAPSGTGKSTLLRLMAGLSPDPAFHFERLRGSSSIPLHSLPPERRAIAYAPQHASLFPHLTVAQNVAFASEVRGKSAGCDPLQLLGLSHLAHKRPHTLSGGERKLVSLARALAVPNALLLLLDEPFSGVDRPTRDAFLPTLQAFAAARNLPVLSVTHDMEEALLLQAEVVRLGAGTVMAQGPARQVLAEEIARMRLLLTPDATT